MKTTTIERFAEDVQGLLDAAQRERLLVMRNGKPYAMIVRVENKEEEDFRLEDSADFWNMIEDRRKSPTVPLDDAETELFA